MIRRALLILAIGASLPLSALAEETPAARGPDLATSAPDPNASVTLTLGELQTLVHAAVAQARYQDASLAAKAANTKVQKQIEPH